MCNSAAHNARPARESLRKRLGIRICRLIDARDGNACVYCGATAASSGAHLHLDHLTPKNGAAGDDSPRNLVTACRRCNSARQNMSVVQWAAYAASKFGLVFCPVAVLAHAAQIAA